jgi:hypothetical protein
MKRNFFATATSLIIMLTAILTGVSCRLGTSSSDASVATSAVPNPTASAAADTLTGYYRNTQKTLTFCVQLTTEDNARCADADLAMTPLLIKEVFSDPIAFQLSNPATGVGFLINPSDPTSTVLPTTYDSKTTKLTFAGTTTPKTLWKDTNCQRQTAVYEDGLLQTTKPTRYSDTIQTVGRIVMDFQVITIVQAKPTFDCQPSLSILAQCYSDETACLGATPDENKTLRQSAQDLIDPLVQLKLMTLSEVQFLNGFSYEVSYQ